LCRKDLYSSESFSLEVVQPSSSQSAETQHLAHVAYEGGGIARQQPRILRLLLRQPSVRGSALAHMSGCGRLCVCVQVDPSVSAAVYYVSSNYYKFQKNFAEFYKSSLLYLAFVSSEDMEYEFKLVRGVVHLGLLGFAW
jgi:hypothetical protein